MKVILPSKIVIEHDPIIEIWDWAINVYKKMKRQSSKKLCFDFSGLQFIDPFGTVFLILFIETLKKEGYTLYPQNVSQEIDAHRYLTRMGFFDFFNLNCDYKFTKHDSAGRFVEIRHLEKITEINNTIEDLKKTLITALEDVDISNFFSHKATELLDNVFSHAASSIGAVIMAQTYQLGTKNPCVIFAVGDLGIGIACSIKNTIYENFSDSEAVKKALDYGVSSKSGRLYNYSSPNAHQGAGLFYIRKFLELNSWTGIFTSNGGAVIIDEGKILELDVADNEIIAGTLIGLKLTSDNILDYDTASQIIASEIYEKYTMKKKYDIIKAEDFSDWFD